MCAFSISSLRCDWLASLLHSFTLGQKTSGVRWIGDWVGFRTGVNVVANRYLFIYVFVYFLTVLSVAQIRAMVGE